MTLIELIELQLRKAKEAVTETEARFGCLHCGGLDEVIEAHQKRVDALELVLNHAKAR